METLHQGYGKEIARGDALPSFAQLSSDFTQPVLNMISAMACGADPLCSDYMVNFFEESKQKDEFLIFGTKDIVPHSDIRKLCEASIIDAMSGKLSPVIGQGIGLKLAAIFRKEYFEYGSHTLKPRFDQVMSLTNGLDNEAQLDSIVLTVCELWELLVAGGEKLEFFQANDSHGFLLPDIGAVAFSLPLSYQDEWTSPLRTAASIYRFMRTLASTMVWIEFHPPTLIAYMDKQRNSDEIC